MFRSLVIVLLVVLVGSIIKDLDARKIDSSLRKRADRSRQKRQAPLIPHGFSDFFGGYSPSQSSFASQGAPYMASLYHSGVDLNTLVHALLQNDMYVNEPPNLKNLQDHNICHPSSHLFKPNAFSAFDMNHLTIPPLAPLRLFPVQTVDLNMLHAAQYIKSFDQGTVLTAIGIQAMLIGHIVSSQLSALQLFPMPRDLLNFETLLQAQYITKDCLPTALGMAAFRINYINVNDWSSTNCLDDDDDGDDDPNQYSLAELQSARYVDPESTLITPVGLAAVFSQFITMDIYSRLHIFPLALPDPVQPTDDTSEDQAQVGSRPRFTVNDFVHAGYLHSSTSLLTQAAVHAMAQKYLTIDYFRSLNVWPCPGKPSMAHFLAAGYVTHSSHLTQLGNSLYNMQYFPTHWLTELGIQLPADYHIFSNALQYSGYSSSGYHVAHTAALSSSSHASNNISQAQPTLVKK